MPDQLNPELLLALFKSLNSQDMIKSKRVCRAWSDVVNGNKSLYRHLVLPQGKYGWDISILKLFEEKSNSGLREISMYFDASIEQFEDLIRILARCEESLRRVSIIWDYNCPINMEVSEALISHCFYRMPRLLELKLQIAPDVFDTSSILREVSNSIHSSSSKLQVLWLFASDFLLRPPSRLGLLDNLVSLRLSEPLDDYGWRDLLEACSETLKDLKMSFRQTIISELCPEPTELDFPRLEFLFIDGGWDVPEWMRIPFSCTIRICSTTSSLIPSVSRLFVGFIDRSAHLSNLCPLLKELRVEVTRLPEWATATTDVAWGDWTWSRKKEQKNNWEFLEMLRKRRRNVEDGVEIDGVKMIHLKTLVVSFNYFSRTDPEFIDKARDLVEEVVDLETVQRFVEVEI